MEQRFQHVTTHTHTDHETLSNFSSSVRDRFSFCSASSSSLVEISLMSSCQPFSPTSTSLSTSPFLALQQQLLSLLLPSVQPVGGIEACKLAQSAAEWSEYPFLLYSHHESLRCHISFVPPHSSAFTLFFSFHQPCSSFSPHSNYLFSLSPLSISRHPHIFSPRSRIHLQSLAPLSLLSNLTFTLKFLIHCAIIFLPPTLHSCLLLLYSSQSSDCSVASQAVCKFSTVPFVHVDMKRGRKSGNRRWVWMRSRTDKEGHKIPVRGKMTFV